MAKKSKAKLFVFAVIIAVAAFFLYPPVAEMIEARAFPEDVLREFEQICTGPTHSDGDQPPPRTGKMVVINPSVYFVYSGSTGHPRSWITIPQGKRRGLGKQIDPPRLHGAWYSLDASMRALTPEEVETVVFCQTMSIKTGKYVPVDGQGPNYAAHRRDVRIVSYDRKTGKFLGSCVLRGTSPPMKTTILGNHAGASPDVLSAIAEMPLRSAADFE